MRTHLQFLLFDGFDPDTGELALRVGTRSEGPEGKILLRLKLLLGRSGDPLQPLRRELQTHAQTALPSLWERGLKLIIHAIEDELSQPEGRDPQRYTWVQTQILHPSDERRGTLNHPVARQVEILWDWAQRMDQDDESLRAMELLERLLLLSSSHVPALTWLLSLLRQHGLVEEMLTVADRLLAAKPGDIEALLRRGEVLLHLERCQEAVNAFSAVLKTNPVHPLAHLGAAQAKSLMEGDPFPHLDAAHELDQAVTLSVLRETFDYRTLEPKPNETLYALDDLPSLLGVSPGEVRSFASERGLPLVNPNTVRESEISRWVSIQNRYQLLGFVLHWMAPTPRYIPEIT